MILLVTAASIMVFEILVAKPSSWWVPQVQLLQPVHHLL